MKFDRYLIDNGERVLKNTANTSWPYPYVNPKVIEKDNNEAQMFFLAMPDIEKFSENTQIAENEGLTWGHKYAVPENSSSSAITGRFRQMESGGHYPSGFNFSVETETPSNGLSPCIGFNAQFELTPENLGGDRYNGLASILKTQDRSGNWALPGAAVLTDLGVHIYRMNGSAPEDITDGVSFGIDMTGADNGLLLLSYGAVMADSDAEFKGKALNLSGEDELVWSDGAADGFITGEWWIGLDTDDYMAGGDGTEASPYKIETARQLNRVRYGLDKHYVLAGDIDLSGYGNWQPIGAYVPFSEGDEENPDLKYAFTGTLNGGNFTISNLTIDRSDEASVGLFGCVVGPVKTIEITGMKCPNCANHVSQDLLEVEGVKFVQIDTVIGGVSTAKVILGQDTEDSAALDESLKAAVEKRKTAESISEVSVKGPSVYNLAVQNVSVNGSVLAGGVVGYAAYCCLENVTLPGDNNAVSGSAMIGGIAGGGFADFTGCHASADIVVSETMIFGGETVYGYAGILAGGTETSSFAGCTAGGTITADSDNVRGLGGLAGCSMESALVDNCSANVTIAAAGDKTSLIGGLLGFSGTSDEENPTVILNCSAEANISVNALAERVGGLIGGGFFAAGYEAYYPVPTMYKITDCETTGHIEGGSFAVGSIAGHAYKSEVTGCSSNMTWAGGVLDEIGEIQA